jgi:hypothetical protein
LGRPASDAAVHRFLQLEGRLAARFGQVGMESPRNRPTGLMTPTAGHRGGSLCLIPPQGRCFKSGTRGGADVHQTSRRARSGARRGGPRGQHRRGRICIGQAAGHDPGPGEPIESYDIGTVDEKAHLYYQTDRSNKSIDIFDVAKNTFVARVPGFVGFTGNGNTSGGNGASLVNNSLDSCLVAFSAANRSHFAGECVNSRRSRRRFETKGRIRPRMRPFRLTDGPIPVI